MRVDRQLNLSRGRKRQLTTTIDRLSPHSVEAERGVLGSIFLLPDESAAEAVDKLPTPEVFYDLRHRIIYEVLIEMFDERAAIDIITVQQRLKDRRQLDGIGGGAYLSSLPDGVPSAANLGYYIEIVREKFILRRLIQVCTGVVSEVYEHEGEVDALLDRVERDILSIAQIRAEAGGILSMKELVGRTNATIEDFHQRKGAMTGVATGFPDLDKMTCGLNSGEMIVIAARPSVGKTSLAMNIAEHVASGPTPLPVGIFSLEMTADSLALRMLCSRARVNLKTIRDGSLEDRDFQKLSAASVKLSAAPIYIDDTGAISVLQLRARARRMWHHHGIKLFVIDYLQLLHSTNHRAANRQQEIADISGGIKALGKELRVPVLVACQLNREVEKQKRAPIVADLRDSGAIEQDADLVALLYRPDDADEDAASAGAEVVPVTLIIGKQRNGPTGAIDLTFLKEYTRFESSAKST